MRICIIDPKMHIVVFDKDSYPEGVEEALVSIKDKANLNSFNTMFFGYRSLRIRLCRKLLYYINMYPWLPSFFALFPLMLCRQEIVENLLGFDPDVICLERVRWGHILKKLIGAYYPNWVYLTTAENSRLKEKQNWRKYDPSVKVSIVLPTFNGLKYIHESIESCLNQTHRNIELIVVDDGSTQDIRSLVLGYNDPRILYLRHDGNRGVAESLNTGFRASTGEYLTWTSDDNFYEKTAIEDMVRFLQTYPEIDFVYTDLYLINENGSPGFLKMQRVKPVEWSKRESNGIGACFLYKRKVYEVIGDYNPELFLVEDYDYWIRVSKKFRMQRLFKPLYYYRYHGDSLTSKYNREEVKKKVKLVKKLNKI